MHPEYKQARLAIYEEYRVGCFRITACSALAARHGVRPGMPLPEAMALARLTLEKSDPLADRKALEKLAAWCEQFSPLVAIMEPDCLLMDMTGLAHLFGGEETLIAQIQHAFQRMGLKTRIALTDTFAAAWSLSHFHRHDLLRVPPGEALPALVELPVASLNLPSAITSTLIELGIDLLGQLLALPRQELAARFEPLLLHRVDEVTGRIQESLTPYRVLAELTRTFEFESPVQDRFVLEAAIGKLLQQVLPGLVAERKGISRFVCHLEGEFTTDARVTISLYQATANHKHLRDLVALQLEKLSLPGPVSFVRLLICSTALLPVAQLGFFDEENGAENRQQLSQLVNRLASRLGPLAVVKSTLVADAQAEFAYRYQPLSQKQRSIKRAFQRGKPLQRPLWLLPVPAPLNISDVFKGPPRRFQWQGQSLEVYDAQGPERIQAGWWRGKYVKRDYYRVATTVGTCYWLFRDRRGAWFLHGIFD